MGEYKTEELQLFESIVKQLLQSRLDIAALSKKVQLLSNHTLQLKKEIDRLHLEQVSK